jgi:hypothetical protein
MLLTNLELYLNDTMTQKVKIKNEKLLSLKTVFNSNFLKFYFLFSVRLHFEKNIKFALNFDTLYNLLKKRLQLSEG